MRVTLWTAPIVAALITLAAPANAGVREGVEKWQAGDYKGAVTEWLPLAARGDADAQFNLGQAYKLGRGVAKNPQIALDYYRKAATRGHAPAQEKLGLGLYVQPATRAEGFDWLQRAAKNKQPRAQYVLGVAHFNGDSVPKNWPLAYAYMLRAQNAGIAQAQTALDTMNANIPVNDRQKGEEIATAMLAGSFTPPVAVAQAPVSAPATPAAVPTPLGVRSAVASPVPPQTPVSANANSWRIQLGAYSQKGLAAEAWTSLKAVQGSLVAGAEPIYTEAGNMVRLQVGPFASRADATRLCTRLQAVGRSCFVVR